MKSTQLMLLATTLVSAALTACGTPMLNSQPMGGINQPRQISQVNRLSQTNQVHTAYYNLILKTGYDPDLNGHHFGFDFGNVSYINIQGKTIELNLRYSAQGKRLWVTLIEQGAPQDQLEHVDQGNHARLQEIATELRKLGAGTPQDKANINRIANLLEHPPA